MHLAMQQLKSKRKLNSDRYGESKVQANYGSMRMIAIQSFSGRYGDIIFEEVDTEINPDMHTEIFAGSISMKKTFLLH